LLHGDEELPYAKEKTAEYEHLIAQRAKRIPLQHITGECGFMGLTFLVSPDALIPRQDTETLVEEAMKDLHDGMRILDLCTGTGCILLSLLHYSNDCEGTGSDFSEKALVLAKKNAERILGEDDKTGAARFVLCDLWDGIEGEFDLVVSNPPYIASDVIGSLQPEVRDHDPRMALDGGPDGLSFYRRIIDGLSAHLVPGGEVLFEIGYDQGKALSELLSDAGYKYIEIIRDLSGLDRVVKARKPV
ncbi:MAG: peptide chain release factor N(5)-glutamine methyltransferase, partial [Lachnospiraceae bacterium]|nr:peptide chain release factor N(5)-glutamine methyltransferase [Lachnospiraceae bacterium]